MDFEKFHHQGVYTVVSVTAPEGLGSGTLLYSRPHPAGKKGALSYVLTNHHVIKSAITYKMEWSTLIGREIKVAHTAEVTIGRFHYHDLSGLDAASSHRAHIVAYDAVRDLALLEVRGQEPFPYTATLLPEEGELYMGMQVVTIGCPLGHKPLPTTGILSSLDEYVDNRRFLLSCAPQIFGNSGGASFVYLPDDGGTWYLVGTPSMIDVVYGNPVPHLSYIIPHQTIRDFLEEQYYHFVLDDSKTYEECERLRTEQRDALQQALEARFQKERSEGA